MKGRALTVTAHGSLLRENQKRKSWGNERISLQGAVSLLPHVETGVKFSSSSAAMAGTEMNDLWLLLARHGYTALGVVVGLGALGLPLPVTLALITAGAASATGLLRPEFAFLVAGGALMLSDTVLFFLGRYSGWWLLGVLCRASLNPETCILRSAESFYRRGRLAIILAKFMPAVGALAPPLAGSMNMGAGQFLRLELLAVCLYTGLYESLGFLFGDLVLNTVRNVQPVGNWLKRLVVFGLILYLGHRIYRLWKQREDRNVPRVDVHQLAARIVETKLAPPPIIDVRSHGYYDAGAVRIKGSTRVEPNDLLAAIKDLPREKEIYVYCT
jgi:membrane protein DedA with SNARE-associated domain